MTRPATIAPLVAQAPRPLREYVEQLEHAAGDDFRVDRIGASHSGDPESSSQAARLNFPRSGTQRWKVLEALAARPGGGTFEDLQVDTGIDSAAKRLTELKRGGWASTEGKRRPTSKGGYAEVHHATAKARHGLEAERTALRDAGLGGCGPTVLRFLKYVEFAEDGCWIWRGNVQHNGYGRFWIARGKQSMAHRWIYEQAVGAIPDGHQLDHLCGVPRCVNPSHLDPVTNAENTRRSSTSKLSPADVVAIRESPERQIDLARQYGVDPSTINDIVHGRKWVADPAGFEASLTQETERQAPDQSAGGGGAAASPDSSHSPEDPSSPADHEAISLFGDVPAGEKRTPYSVIEDAA